MSFATSLSTPTEALKTRSPATPPTSPSRKRKTSTAAGTTIENGLPSPRSSPKKLMRHVQWKGLLGSELKTCFLFNMPQEIGDKILGSPELNLRDHVALAATCKSLRAIYTDLIWQHLITHRSLPTMGHVSRWPIKEKSPASVIYRMFSSTQPVDLSKMIIEPSDAHRRAIELVNDGQRLTQTDAKIVYKVSVAELKALRCEKRRNRHNRRAPIELYLECAVEALAFRSHGGPAGHRQHILNLQAKAKKALETKKKNGTSPLKKPRLTVPFNTLWLDDFNTSYYPSA